MSVIASFVAFVVRDADRALLTEFSRVRGFAESHIYPGSIREAVEFLKTNPSPDMLLVEIPALEEAQSLLDALADVCDPHTKVLTMGEVNEYSFYCWLMDMGIANYLLSPLTEQVLEAAFQKLQTPIAGGKHDKPPAKLIAIVGARGGVGSTSVAINFAGVLAEQTHQKVALVDLDPQEGSVALALDIEPTHGLRDALEKPERIDSLFLERVMAKLGKYLSVLSAEENLSDHLAVNEQAADPLLAEIRAKYDYVVLDVPRHMTGFAQNCLRMADYTILVSELTLLCLRDTLRLQDAMREGWKAKPPLIVANRVGLAAKHEVPIADFEKGINTKITEQIAFAPDVFMPIMRDIAAVKFKHNPAVKPIYHLVHMIVPNAKPLEPEAKKKDFSFFKRKEGS